MTESARKVSAALTLFMAVFIGTTALVAQATREQIVENQAGEDRALIITEKRFDEQTGKLHVKLLNTNEQFSVTAFGIMMVVADQEGKAHPRVNSRDTVPGNEAILPGGTYDLVVGFEPQVEQKFRARTVKVHFEILSDTTSHGNTFMINEFFRSRAHHAVEIERALDRLNGESLKLDTPDRALAILNQEAARVRRSRSELLVSSKRSKSMSTSERGRLAAQGAVAEMADQYRGFIGHKLGSADGLRADEALVNFESVLETMYQAYAENIRQTDLHAVLAEEIDGE